MRAPTDRPNIILINCDDLGYGDLGCYGSRRNSTPALDRMAAEGMRFTDFYMAAPVCSPSRGAMMTGCYPRRIGFATFDGRWVLFPGQGVGLNPDEVTIADLLKERGYATRIVGKWHCGDQPEFMPTRFGFDGYYGLPYSNDMGRQRGRENQYPPLPLLRDEQVIQQQPDQASLTERYVEDCVRFIRDNREQPFFLYFAHMYVHLPLYAPKRFMEQSRNGRYGAAVECVDWSVDVLLSELRRLGLDENTLVVFTSDNGSRNRDEGGSNAPLRGTKGTTWEGGMRLPCIVRWPGRVSAGETCSELATSMDLLPTLARLAGTREPDDRVIDGHDIAPLMLGEEGAESPWEEFYYYYRDRLDAVRRGRWKLRLQFDEEGKVVPDGEQLYDLQADVGETTDLSGDLPDVVAEMEEALNRGREELGDEATGAEGRNLRPIGRVEDPEPLTEYDPDHPYIVAIYDLEDAG
ncbi:MAG: sulfatase [Planctomycetota bacterium]